MIGVRDELIDVRTTLRNLLLGGAAVAAALLATFGLAAVAVESSGGATARATDPCFGYAICDH